MTVIENVTEIKKDLKLISVLEKKYNIKPNNDVQEPMLYCGVAESDLIKVLSADVEQYFGKPFKPAGESCFFKNLFDRFLKNIGGARKDQTIYKKVIDENVVLFCAFWPWGSQPVKTSIRIGLLCYDEDEEAQYESKLKGYF